MTKPTPNREEIMEAFSWAWLPIVIVLATALALSNFFFAMLALVVLLPILLAAPVVLAGAIVAAPFLIGRSLLRHWRDTSVRPGAVLTPANRHNA